MPARKLSSICPPLLPMRCFVASPMFLHTYLILNELNRVRQSEVMVQAKPVMKSALCRIYDILDHDLNVIGNVIRHRPMRTVYVGDNVLNFSRSPEDKRVEVVSWYGDFVLLLEGDFSATVVNLCEKDNLVTQKLDSI